MSEEELDPTAAPDLPQEFLNAAVTKKSHNTSRPAGKAYSYFADAVLGFAATVSLILAYISLPLGFIVGVCVALEARSGGILFFAICLVSGFLNSAFNYALYVVFTRVQDHLGRRP